MEASTTTSQNTGSNRNYLVLGGKALWQGAAVLFAYLLFWPNKDGLMEFGALFLMIAFPIIGTGLFVIDVILPKHLSSTIWSRVLKILLLACLIALTVYGVGQLILLAILGMKFTF